MPQRDLGTCLFCVPIKFGVTCIAALLFAYGFICTLVLFVQDIRFQPGGYSSYTRRLPAIVGAAGLVFGVVGLLGVSDNKPLWVGAFARYQDVKLAVALLVFLFDSITLLECSTFEAEPYAEKRNPVLYHLSTNSLCSMATLCYRIGFAIDFGFSYYFAWVTHEYRNTLSTCPSYFISFPEVPENHTQVKLFDPAGGEPIQHLGPATARTADTYGTL
mmetsp:Transcript_66517/g.214354  ORF Transcript_66517/g.214354 Transcript_66517/m.214354 type:complete len:217 (-) Transcript_66517:61-711(-)